MACPKCETGAAGSNSHCHCICGGFRSPSVQACEIALHIDSPLGADPASVAAALGKHFDVYMGAPNGASPLSSEPVEAVMKIRKRLPGCRRPWCKYLQWSLALAWCAWAVAITVKVF